MASYLFDNMYCGLIRRGDVFICESAKGKEYPVLVLQDTVLNDGLSTVISARISMVDMNEEPLVNEVILEKDETGLGKRGMCLLHKLETVPRGQMVAKKGEVSAQTLQRVYRALDITCGRFRDR